MSNDEVTHLLDVIKKGALATSSFGRGLRLQRTSVKRGGDQRVENYFKVTRLLEDTEGASTA